MFNFWTRKSSRESLPVSRRTLLALEPLETRDCPAGPAIASLTTTVLANKMVSLTGTVTDSNPASVTLTFSGVMAGTTQANRSGVFSYTAQASSLGTVSAVAVDAQNLTSPTVQATVSTQAPHVSLTVAYGSQRTVTLSGRVTGVNAGSLTVTFSGVVTGSIKTNSDGTFTYTASATGLGGVQAATVDLWNQNSNSAQVTLSAQNPVITNFQATDGSNGWTFSGTVTDQTPAGLTITFGGFPAMQGKSITVNSDGTFSVIYQLTSDDYGTATAQTKDWWGLVSNLAQFYVA